MRHVDFSPLYRSTVGFDRLFTMLDSLAQPEGAQTYPPYNIERTGEDSYRISMAVAGFSDDELSIEAQTCLTQILKCFRLLPKCRMRPPMSGPLVHPERLNGFRTGHTQTMLLNRRTHHASC